MTVVRNYAIVLGFDYLLIPKVSENLVRVTGKLYATYQLVSEFEAYSTYIYISKVHNDSGRSNKQYNVNKNILVFLETYI